MATFRELPPHLQKLLKRLRPTIRRGFLEAIRGITSAAVLADVTAAIETGNVFAVTQTLNLDKSFFGPLTRAIDEVYWQAGSSVSLRLSPQVQNAVLLPFNGSLPRAEAWVREQSAALITGPKGIIEDQRQMVREVLEVGLRNNRHPQTIALDLVGRVSKITKRREGGFIGLTSGQERAAQGVRDKLASGDPTELRKYKRLKLRDRRFDPTIDAAIESGKPIPARKINTIVGRYTDRTLKHRADVIAEDQALTAIEAGREEGFEQLVENGTIEKEQIRKFWRHTGITAARKHRPDHVAMNGESVSMDAFFIFPFGVQKKHPRDEGGGAAHNLGCDCWLDYVIKKRI